MLPNSYNLKSDQTSAVGSVNLANATAETFVQNAKNTPISNVVNCFLCHNPTSYSFQTPPPPKLSNRLIALSHVLSYGSIYEVPNSISGKLLRRPLIHGRSEAPPMRQRYRVRSSGSARPRLAHKTSSPRPSGYPCPRG